MNLSDKVVTRRETFYKLTNSAVAPEAPSAGGRNLLKRNQIINRGLSTFSYSESTGIYDCVAPKNSGVWGYGIAYADRFTSIPEGKTLIFSMEVKPDVDCVWNNDINNTCVGLPSNPSGNDNDDTSKRKNSDRNLRKEIWNTVWFSYTAKNPTTGYTLYDCTTNFGIVTTGLAADIHFQMRKVKAELAENATPYSVAPEDLGWTMNILVPTQPNRYLWKFEYIYYSDGTIEVTEPINLSVAGQNGQDGQDGKNSYIHTAYANITKMCNENASFTLTTETIMRFGYGDKWVYKTFGPGTYTANNTTFGRDPYSGKTKQCDAITDFSISDSTGRSWLGTYSDNNVNAVSNPSYYTWQLTKGDRGEDGIAGKDGVGLKSTLVTYGLSRSETDKPITWYSQVPTLTKGDYLWTKTVWTYTDNTSETGYQKTYIARDGNNGHDGIPGKDGVGIKSTTITYASSTSGTTRPTSGWSSTIPNVPHGQYLWTKTVWTYTDDSSETGYSVAKMGENGQDGQDGKNSYIHTAYANITKMCNENASFTLTTETIMRFGYGDKWVYKTFGPGTYTANNTTFGRDPYSGKTKQCDAITDFSISDSTGRSWLGTYSDNNVNAVSNPSYYTWQLTKGDRGEDGIAGKDGVGLKSTLVTYGLSRSETDKPITWYSQVPTLTKGDYLWTKTVWTYTDNTSETGYQKTYIARDGNNGHDGIPGKDGVGIKSTTITYASSTSGTTRPTSGWSSTIPNVPHGQYLWTKTVWTYTDDSSETGYSVAKMGENGRGLEHTEDFYQLTSTSTTPSYPTSGSTNLLRYTSVNSDNLNRFDRSNSSISVVTKDGHQTYKIVVSASGNSGVFFNGNSAYYNLIKDRYYTFSFWVLTNKDKDYNFSSLGHIQSVNYNSDKVGNDALHQHTSPVYNTSVVKANTWTKVWCTFKATSNSYFKPYFWYLRAGDEIYIYDMMLNEGKSPDPYTIAPEDLGWSKGIKIPTSDKRFLWKFSINYFSDETVEIAQPTLAGSMGIQGIQGPKGDQGIPGVPGADGRTQYTHIAYADNDKGGGFSQTDQNKAYIGMYQDFIATDSSDPTRYKWSKWKGSDGAQGIPGKPGADGRTPYMHFAYADDNKGTNFSLTDKNQQYQGYYSDYTEADSTDYRRYKWVDRLVGIKGGSRNYFKKSLSRTFNTTNDGTFDYRTFIVNDFWKNKDRFKKNFVKISFDITFPVALSNDYMANIHFSATPWWSNRVTFKAGTTSRQHFEFPIDLSNASEDYYTDNVFIRFGTTYGFPSNFKVIIDNMMLSIGSYYPDYNQAIEDIQDQIDDKADQELTQEQINALAEKNALIQAEMEAKASMDTVNQWITAYQNYVNANNADKKKSEQALQDASNRLLQVQYDVKGLKQQWDFIDTYMSVQNEGLIIGKKDGSAYAKFSNDRISLFSGNSEVMYISQGTLNIANGIFTKTIQIGRFRFETHPADVDMLVIRYLGG